MNNLKIVFLSPLQDKILIETYSSHIIFIFSCYSRLLWVPTSCSLNKKNKLIQKYMTIGIFPWSKLRTYTHTPYKICLHHRDNRTKMNLVEFVHVVPELPVYHWVEHWQHKRYLVVACLHRNVFDSYDRRSSFLSTLNQFMYDGKHIFITIEARSVKQTE